MWSGTIGDSRVINETQLIGYPNQSFQPQQIILGHANLPPITHCYAQLLDITQSRNLQTEVFLEVLRAGCSGDREHHR